MAHPQPCLIVGSGTFALSSSSCIRPQLPQCLSNPPLGAHEIGDRDVDVIPIGLVEVLLRLAQGFHCCAVFHLIQLFSTSFPNFFHFKNFHLLLEWNCPDSHFARKEKLELQKQYNIRIEHLSPNEITELDRKFVDAGWVIAEMNRTIGSHSFRVYQWERAEVAPVYPAEFEPNTESIPIETNRFPRPVD